MSELLSVEGGIRPPLKWAGGKRWLVRHIKHLWKPYEERDYRFVEPLCGGLAVTLGLMPKFALLNDINPHLINFYLNLKRGLKADLPMRFDKDLYYNYRRRLNGLIKEGRVNTPEGALLLPLPANLVSSSSDIGETLLLDADAREAYFALANNFLTQKNQAFCGVASMVMVFNAMQLPAPAVPEYEPYKTFTQDNVLDARTEAVLPAETIKKQGMTLDQLGALFAIQPVSVSVHHAADSSIEEFRSKAQEYLGKPNHFVVVNYLRKAIGQEKGGHISPLAAYDRETDRFLILDVARYKYPPVWVKADELFAAMNTQDADNDKKTRGYVLVAKK